MAQEPTPKDPKKAPIPDQPVSAPELPAAVARQYGLHRYHPAPHSTSGALESPEDGILEDPETQAAVEDIVAQESDTVLEAEDARFRPPPEAAKKRGFWRTLARPFAFWWRHKWLRWLTILAVLAATGVVVAMPKTRYAVLNKAGVRSSAQVTVLDQTTQLPLRNVQVSLGGVVAQTDKEGRATLRELPLGPNTLKVRRVAFAPITKQVTIGWGSNPLGSFSMTATGIQYTIVVTDFLSGKPLEGAEASSADIHALSDKQGKITLTIHDTNLTEFDVQVGLPGYRSEALKLQTDQDTIVVPVVLIPAKKTVFVSRTAGKYDVYAMDLDGKNRTVVLPGTGTEGQNISLAVHASGDRAAMVSTRDPVRDQDGALLSTLTVVDIATGAATTVEHALQIQLVDWMGDRLVYQLTMPGAGNADAQRQRLVTYDYRSKVRTQLASANEFKAVKGVADTIYYVVSNPEVSSAQGLFKIKPDGTGKINLFQQAVWSLLRTSYSTLLLQAEKGWYSYTIGSVEPQPATQPSSYEGYAYIEDARAERSLWVDERDGKGALLIHDNKSNADTIVHTQEGLVYPVRWLDDHTAVFRVATAGETSDYAKSVRGGDAKKLTDVTNTFGYVR